MKLVAVGVAIRWSTIGDFLPVHRLDDVVGVAEVRRLEERVRDLERMLGRKTLEVEILKDALDLAREKSDLAVELGAKGQFPMKVVTDTLSVVRSSIAERVKGVRPKRRPQTREGDLELNAEIRRLLDARPTYGYRRIAALFKRERRSAGLPSVNAKRVYRFMKKQGLLLARHTGPPQ